ncbi:transmembrane protein 35B-like isoform X1 [Liolophura sinensis]|uniref:transmembrane protein 35B-like isoform X1 n=1 Tax=Liolophura sinensis TaxID=3198878 RepID=UPI003158B927
MPGQLTSILQGAVGGIFVLAGITKVYPFTKEMAADTLKEFTAFAKVYPTVPLGYQPDPKFYQMSLGMLEVIFGLGLLTGPRRCKRVCSGGMIFIMAGGVQTMLCLGRISMAAMPLAFLGALVYIWMSLGKNGAEKKRQ